MAGFYGIVCLKGSNHSKDIKSLPNLNTDSVVKSRYDFESFHLSYFAYKHSESKLGRSSSGNIIFSYAGYIHALELPGLKRRNGSNLASYLAEAYEAKGDDLWQKLNGNWVSAVWDCADERLVLSTDRQVACLYYTYDDNRCEFSTSLLAMAQYGTNVRKLDVAGALEVLTIGRSIDDRTFLEGVKLVRDAAVLTFHKGKVTEKIYWRPDFTPDNSISFEDAADKLNFVLDRAVERCAKGRFGLGLSGGLDSRKIAARVHDCCEIATTFGADGGLEVTSAQAVCEKIGLPLQVCHYTAEQAGREYERWIQLNDGYIFCPEFILLTEKNSPRNERIIFGGFGSGFRGLCGCPALAKKQDANKIFSRRFTAQCIPFFEERNYEKVLGAKIPKELYGSVRRSSERLLKTIEAPTTFDQFYWLELVENRRRSCLVMDAGRAFMDVYQPYMDNEFVEFILRIPAWMKDTKTDVYRRAFIKRWPELAALPNARGSNYISEAEQKLSKFVLKKKIWYLLPDKVRTAIYTRLGYQAISPSSGIAYKTTLAKPLRKAIQTLADVELLKQSCVERLLHRHFKGVETKESLFHRLLPLGYIIDKYGLSL